MQPVEDVGGDFVAVALVEQLMTRVGIEFDLYVLVAGGAQSIAQVLLTTAVADRVTGAANHQQRQATVDLRKIFQRGDLLQPAEQVDPQLIAAAEAAQWIVDVLVDFLWVAAQPVESGAVGLEGFV